MDKMRHKRESEISFWLRIATLVVLAPGIYMTSCSSKTENPTLPSINSGQDLQYFPPGPEFKLTRQVQAIEEYKLRQQGKQSPEERTDDEQVSMPAEGATQERGQDDSEQEN